jgi:hypothetical protein
MAPRPTSHARHERRPRRAPAPSRAAARSFPTELPCRARATAISRSYKERRHATPQPSSPIGLASPTLAGSSNTWLPCRAPMPGARVGHDELLQEVAARRSSPELPCSVRAQSWRALGATGRAARGHAPPGQAFLQRSSEHMASGGSGWKRVGFSPMSFLPFLPALILVYVVIVKGTITHE